MLELSALNGTSMSQVLLVMNNCRRCVERLSEPEAIDFCYKKTVFCKDSGASTHINL